MSELKLSSDARRRLLQCYALLLSLAEEAEENTHTDSELCKDQESAMETKTPEVVCPSHGTSETKSEQSHA